MSNVYADIMSKVIFVDERSGHGALRLSLASLLMNGREPIHEIHLASDLLTPALNFMPHGTWAISGTHRDFKFNLSGVPLPGGAPLDFDIDMSGTGLLRGAGVVVDAEAFVKAKRALAEQLDREDTLSDAELDKLSQAERDAISERTSFRRYETDERSVSLIAKNGVAHVFECTGGGASGDTSKVLLKSIVLPSGRSLEFKWQGRTTQPRLVSIEDETGEVLKATWSVDASTLEQLIVFPDSDEQITGTITAEENVLIVSLVGAGIDAHEQEYRIDTTGGKIQRVEANAHYQLDGSDDKTTRTDTELLSYDAQDRVERYSMTPASNSVDSQSGGYEPLVATYSYDSDKVTVVYAQGEDASANELERRVYAFDASGVKSITSTVKGQTTTETRVVDIDNSLKTATITTTVHAGDAQAETTVQKFDARGNLIAFEQGDQVSEWTYYNDYDQYSLSETTETVHSANFGNIGAVLLDYANPIGLGFQIFGKSGLTWHTLTHTRVSTTPTGSNYAKAAFNLPLDLNYPGSAEGFSTHIESELVCRKEGDVKHPQQLTYFGYDKLTSVKHSGLSRQHVLVPSVKLTVVQPAYEEVDISAAQLVVAQAAAKAYTDNLNARIADEKSSDEDKEGFTNALTQLNEVLEAQSKFNGIGFKLIAPYVADAMQVETLTYETDEKSPGFGQVKTITSYWLDAQGAQNEASLVRTTFDYSCSSDKRTLTTKTLVKTADDLEVVSSCTCSALSGRLHESTDTEGVSTVNVYDRRGRISKTTLKRGDEILSETDYSTSVPEDGQLHFLVQDAKTRAASRLESSLSGLAQRRYETADGQTWLQLESTTCDARGRPASTTEYDYDCAGKAVSTKETRYDYDDALNTCTISYLLKDGEGVSLDSQTVTWTAEANLTRMELGAFKYEQCYAPGDRTLTAESGLAEGGQGLLRVQTLFNPAGQPVSVKRYAVKDGNETELISTTCTYGVDGLPSSRTGQSGDRQFSSSYEHDHFGRLIKQDSNGLLINNSYSGNGLSSVAAEAKLDGVSLGTQTADGLGRVKNRTVNGAPQAFSYNGASRWAKTGNLEQPGLIEGYQSAVDQAAFTYSEICPVRATLSGPSTETLSTISNYSYRGQLLSVTDVKGYTTRYGYDAFGRVREMASDACNTTLTYRDDGQVLQETVSDVLSGRCLTIDYAYDATGNETSRTFALDGMATHELKRELAADGRLVKSVLSLDGAEHASDEYQYDSQGQLTQWVGKNKSFNYNTTQTSEQSFSYDQLSNVIETHPTQVEESPGAYRWSPIIKRAFDPDKPGLLKKHGSYDFSSDDKGRWTVKGTTYHANGKVNRIDFKRQNYQDMVLGYDDLGRLRGMFLQGGNYDPYGYQFHYRNGKIYARSEVRGNTRIEQVLLNDSNGCYLQHRRDRDSYSKTDTSKTSFELRDAAGTIFATVNDAGEVTYHTYSPYGFGATDTWLGFKGEAKLVDGTYYLGSERIYNPEYMSFQSPDSWFPFGPVGPVAYAYCSGDPVNFHDPSGHQEVAHYSYVSAYPIMYSREFRIGIAVAGLLLAPFTGGNSLLISIAVTGLAIVASAFEIASVALEESDPKLSETLGYIGLGFGIASAVGAVGATKFAARGAGRVAARSGEEFRASYFSDVNQYVPFNPRHGRPTHWHQISMPSTMGGGVRHIWGADTKIFGSQIMTPLRQIARRGSTSDIHIFTGVHGRRSGNNWLDTATPLGRPMAVRDPALNAQQFYMADVGRYQMLDAFMHEPGVQQALSNRQVYVTDIGTMLASDMNTIEMGGGHYIHGYCYSRNDERLLYNYVLPPVTSYVDTAPFWFQPTMPQNVYLNPNYHFRVYI